MKITSVELKNFKSFDSASFEFGDIVRILGDNFQGKTTIAEAVSIGLYGSTLSGSPHTDHLIKNGAKKYEVTVRFVVDGEEHEVTRVKGSKGEVYLDGEKSSQAEVDKWVPDKERFLTVFVPGYFTSLPDKDGREMMMRLIKAPSSSDVVSKLTKAEQELLKSEVLRDPDGLAKELRAEIKTIEAECNRIEGRMEELKSRVNREVPEPMKFDEVAYEQLKQQIADAASGNTSKIAELQRQSQDLRVQYERLKAKLRDLPTAPYSEGEPCPTCAREFDADSLEYALTQHTHQCDAIHTTNEATKVEMQGLIAKGKDIKSEIDTLSAEQDSTDTDDLKSKLAEMEQKRSEVMAHNAYASRIRMEVAEDKTTLEQAEQSLKEMRDEQTHIGDKVKAINAYRAKLAEMQVEQLKQHLNRVDIQLFDVVKSTGEIKPCFTVLYDGKEFKSLSTSERIRCNLEFATLFNKVLGIDAPVYIDNCESITHFDTPMTSQIFTASVVPGKPLTVESVTETKEAIA